MNTDRNLLFGVLALQADLLDPARFVEACVGWTAQKDRPLADLLLGRGWITPADRQVLEHLMELKLKKHGGDPRASLAAAFDDRARSYLSVLGDPDVRQTLSGLPQRLGHVLISTIDCKPGTRERYTLTRLHAQGGIGQIWLARDETLGREVALKELRPERAASPAVWARFLEEARITGQLEHPGIVPVYELTPPADHQQPFYTMRFVRGRTLAEAVRDYHRRRSAGEAGAVDFQALLQALVGVCNAVAYAHARGVLHRDLKPLNVVLGDYGEVIVLDWGLAKLVDRPEDTLTPAVAVEHPEGRGETAAGQTLGTPAYMAPEQAQGRWDAVDRRSDVYGLGAILYEVLAGRPPFDGSDTAEVLRKVSQEPPERPRQHNPEAPRALEAVCLKTLAKRPAARYATATELAREVQRFLADEPVSAWREPLAMRARRWARRNRSLVTAAAAAVLVALMGLAAVLAVQTQANTRLQQANLNLEIANAKATRANADLVSANERERQRFDLAVEAIRRYHTDVSADFLLEQDQFKDLRDRLLRDAIAFYRKLEGLLSGQSDPRSRQALGRAYEEVGELTDKIGSLPEALAAHRRALEVRRELARAPSVDVEVMADLGRSLVAIGLLLERTGQVDQALASFREARSTLGGLAGTGPGHDAILDPIARSYYWSGTAYNHSGMTREARAAFEQARAIVGPLASAHPDVVDYRRLLSWCHNNIGMLLHLEGEATDALSAYRESLRIKRKVVEDHSRVAEYDRDLARGYSNIGILLRMTGKPAEALAEHEEALAIRRRLADAYAAVTMIQADLANSLNEIGCVLRQVGRTDEARASYERALAILDDLAEKNPTMTEVQEWLVEGLTGLGATRLAFGRGAEAVATWRRAVGVAERLRYPSNESLYCLASCHALLGGAAGLPGSGLSPEDGAAELDLAMATLRRAVAAGYRSVEWMRRDPDLEPLRSRSDFQLLMMDLTFPEKPFARGD
jgi:tetratricopeptide (TPR) repeat protein/tRNA A-37 threonylcarbamoyl transferase component Bud32